LPERRYNPLVCTLAIYFRHSANLPLVVAANRDEFYTRATAEPRLLAVQPWVFGGQDLEAGGTWFGVNERLTVVGLLNRRSTAGPDPTRRSRGLFCLEALQRGTPAEIVEWLATLTPTHYNHFNLLAANAAQAFVAVNHGARLSIVSLSPGLHVLTNADVDDLTCPRLARAHRLFARLSPDIRDASRLPPALRPILADHELGDHAHDPTAALCVHTEAYGTRSSSIVALDSIASAWRYWHAPGPPCVTGYVEAQLPGAVAA